MEDKQYYNCHIHLNWLQDVPIDMLVYGYKRKPVNTKKYVNSKFSEMKDLIHREGLEDADKLLGVYFKGLLKNLITLNEDALFECVRKPYRKTIPDMKFAVHTLDFWQNGSRCKPRREYEDQLSSLLNVCKINRNLIIPFLCIDPYRFPNSKEVLKFAVDWLLDGFQGIKIYPLLGYYPFDPKLYDLYEFCQEFNIPITTHCSYGPYFFQNWLDEEFNSLEDDIRKKYNDPSRYRILNPFDRIKEKNSKFEIPENYEPVSDLEEGEIFKKLQDFAHPKHWEKVLKQFPDLKVNLAHMGGWHQMKEYVNKLAFNPAWQIKEPTANEDNWVEYVLYMLTLKNNDNQFVYPNLYTDTSANFWQSTRKGFRESGPVMLKKLCEKFERVKKRMLFGSDFYVVYSKGITERFYSKLGRKIGRDLFDTIASDNPGRFFENNLNDEVLKTKKNELKHGSTSANLK